ncbi:MAG TPA: hypothetical protein VMT30_06320, partial [Candidatus Saccharimonadia bacterium]|nr:hypothetical protein [Candidatus Saccharimonadia bacterium]
GAVETHEAALRQAPVEKARNDAYNATHARVKAAAIAAGRDIKDAEKEAAEAGTRAGNAAYAAKEKKVKDTLETGTPAEVAAMRAEMEQSAITAQGTAAYESAVDQAVAADAKVAALNQAAASPNRLEAAQRLAVSTESQVASIAAQQGADRERYELTRPGQALNRSFQQAEAASRNKARSQIIATRATEAANDDFIVYDYELDKDNNRIPIYEIDTSTGKPALDPSGPNGFKIKGYKVKGEIRDRIKSHEINPTTIPQLEELVEKSLTGTEFRPDVAIAAMDRLHYTNAGREALRRIQYRVFGRTADKAVDGSRFDGLASEIWEQGIANVPYSQAPDLHSGTSGAYDGISAEDYAVAGWTSKRDYHDEVLRQYGSNPELTQAAIDNAMQMLTNQKLSSKLDADNWQEMYRFMQDPRVATAVKDYQGEDAQGNKIEGVDVLERVYKEGNKQKAATKTRIQLVTDAEVKDYNARFTPWPPKRIHDWVNGISEDQARTYNAAHPGAHKQAGDDPPWQRGPGPRRLDRSIDEIRKILETAGRKVA